MRDANGTWRNCQAPTPEGREEAPPRLIRAEVNPYPDLTRLWVRFETTEFRTGPDVVLTVSDARGATVSSMFVVEMRQPYLSVTMHLRQPAQPGDYYNLHIELSRQETELDHLDIDFPLAFRQQTEAEAGDSS